MSAIRKPCPKCNGRLYVNGLCAKCAGKKGVLSSQSADARSASDVEFVDMLGLGNVSELLKGANK